MNVKCCGTLSSYEWISSPKRSVYTMPAALRKRAGILSLHEGGHHYHRHGQPGPSWFCRCGAWMGSSRSGEPSPFGACPLRVGRR